MNAITLDSETHTYRIGDLIVPGYSQIVRDLGIAKHNPFYTDAGREEGIALHLWLAFLVQGRTPSTEPDPRIAGRVEGIRKFIKDTDFKIIGGETPLYDPSNNFACSPDLWGSIGSWFWVVDAKRGSKLKVHRLQTAAQQIALASNGFRAQKRGCLYLTDGNYRLDEHTNPRDARIWQQVVATYHMKQEYI